jgi:hypothetical protein
MSAVEHQEESDHQGETDRRVTRSKRPNVVTRRDVLMLVSVWMAGCAIVTTLLGFFYTQSVAQEPQQPQPIATFVIPFAGHSAKTAYPSALTKAQEWNQDVEMVAAATRWSNTTAQGLGQTENWDFRFFSPEHQRIFFVAVTADQPAAGRAHLYKVKNDLSLIDSADWVIDSNEAISTWVNNGGGVFLENFPENSVEVLLHQVPGQNRPVWDIIAINADQSQAFYLTIDATNGQILN